jgi:hypothetical protein
MYNSTYGKSPYYYEDGGSSLKEMLYDKCGVNQNATYSNSSHYCPYYPGTGIDAVRLKPNSIFVRYFVLNVTILLTEICLLIIQKTLVDYRRELHFLKNNRLPETIQKDNNQTVANFQVGSKISSSLSPLSNRNSYHKSISTYADIKDETKKQRNERRKTKQIGARMLDVEDSRILRHHLQNYMGRKVAEGIDKISSFLDAFNQSSESLDTEELKETGDDRSNNRNKRNNKLFPYSNNSFGMGYLWKSKDS